MLCQRNVKETVLGKWSARWTWKGDSPGEILSSLVHIRVSTPIDLVQWGASWFCMFLIPAIRCSELMPTWEQSSSHFVIHWKPCPWFPESHVQLFPKQLNTESKSFHYLFIRNCSSHCTSCHSKPTCYFSLLQKYQYDFFPWLLLIHPQLEERECLTRGHRAPAEYGQLGWVTCCSISPNWLVVLC